MTAEQQIEEENNKFLNYEQDDVLKSIADTNSEPKKRKIRCTPDIVFKCLIVFGSFIIYFIADGVSFSSGILIRESITIFRATTSASSLTASLIQAIPLFLSPIVCVLIEKYGCRVITFIGSILVVSSFVITKFFVFNLTMLYLTYGCLTSCGLAMCYISAYLILSFCFNENRALAIGIAVSGSGVGVFTIPPLIETLIREYGLLDAYLIFGAISAHMLISACLFRQFENKTENKVETDNNINNNSLPEKNKKEEKIIKKAFITISQLYSNKKYVILTIAYTLLSFLITSPYNFLPDHISINSIDDKNSLSLSVIGISTIFGQIIIGILADRFVKYNWLIYSLCLIFAGIATCILPFLKNLYLIFVYSTVFGFMTSVNYVLQSNLVIEAVGLGNLTYAFGCLQLMQGFSTLTGTPAVAWLKDITGNYNITFFITGAFLFLSGLSLLFWPCVKNKDKLENEETLSV